jgi:apolipoprotein D and lipocalin family protein
MFLTNKQHFILLSLVLMITLFSCKSKKPLETVQKVDLEKYTGRWYEISTIPIAPQKGCTFTYAEYTIGKNGTVKVYNHCIKKGKVSDITGKAFVKDTTTNAQLAVQFFWPFRGAYYIIGLDDNYQWAIVGSPSRKNLWILSRTPQMDSTLYQSLLQTAQNKGFDTNLLVTTLQNCN